MYICRKIWFDLLFFENHDKLNIKKSGKRPRGGIGPVIMVGPSGVPFFLLPRWTLSQQTHQQQLDNSIILEKVHFWPSNFCLSLVLAIELQNQTFLTIQLLKPFTIGHRAVLMSSFNFCIYNLVPRTWNGYYFFLVAPI
jgi:hypothetical protein